MSKQTCCEEPEDQNHKHLCNNAHRLRGMNCAVIGPHPSMFSNQPFQAQMFQKKYWVMIKLQIILSFKILQFIQYAFLNGYSSFPFRAIIQFKSLFSDKDKKKELITYRGKSNQQVLTNSLNI